MPYIPLPRPNTQLARPQVPALDHLERPQIDARRVIAAMGELGRASGMPGVEAGPFIEAAGAQGHALGGALSDAGQVLAALGAKQQQERDRTGMFRASELLDAGGAEAVGYFASNPQKTESWLDGARRIGERVIKSLGDITGLSDVGHKQVQALGGQRHEGLLVNTQAAVIQQDLRNSAEAQVGHVKGLLAQGDVRGAHAMLTPIGQSGVVPAGMMKELEGQVRTMGARQDEARALSRATGPGLDLKGGHEAVAQSVYIEKERKPGLMSRLTHVHGAASQEAYVLKEMEKDPAEAVKLLEDHEQVTLLSPRVREELRRLAVNRREAVGEEGYVRSRDYVDLLDAEKLAVMTPEELDAAMNGGEHAWEWKQAGEFHKALAGDYLKLKQGKERLDDPRRQLALEAAIDRYVPDMDEPWQADQMRLMIREGFGEDKERELMGRLDARVMGKAKVPAVTARARKALYQWAYQNGAAGEGGVRQEVGREAQILSRHLDERAARGEFKSPQESVEFIKKEAGARGWSLEGEDAGEDATTRSATGGAMRRPVVPVALEMKGAQDAGKEREPGDPGVDFLKETGRPTEEDVWAAMRDYARQVFGMEGGLHKGDEKPADASQTGQEGASRLTRKVEHLGALPLEPSVLEQVKSSAADLQGSKAASKSSLEDHGDVILEKSGKDPRKLATRQPDGGVQVENADDVDRVLSHAGNSPVYLPNPDLERARAQDEADNETVERQRQMGGAAAMGVMAPPAPALPRTRAAEKTAQEALAHKRSERTQRYEEAIADLRAYNRDRDEEQAKQGAAIKLRVARGEISEEDGRTELQSLMEALDNRRLGDEVRANQALNGALRDYGEGLISAQQLNTLFEAAGAKMSGVQHYLRDREQRNLGREAEVKMEDFTPRRKGAVVTKDRPWATDPEGHPAAYNPKTGEWHRTETQEMANVLDDAFEAMEGVDRDRLFGEAASEAQISLGRRQELEGLLEDFPTYPGIGASSTERGHVVALAQVLRGMDATLRYAQQAEAEANAPRLAVPFYSFVEKGLEGAPMEEQQMAFAWGAMLMLDYLSLGTMGMATGPLRAIEPGVEALAARSGRGALRAIGSRSDSERATLHSAWKARPGGVRLRKVGNYFVKEVNPEAPALARWWGEGSIRAQAKALDKLREMAPSHIFKNGKLVLRDAGTYNPGNFWNTWLKGSIRMRTPFNDIRPWNIGADGVIFDPAKHPIQQGIEATAIGTAGATAGILYKYFNTEE